MGPTGSGKTELAERIADLTGAQLINADAFQIYRGLTIGTAKPDDPSRYLLVDVLAPQEPFGVGEFVTQASEHLAQIYEQGRSAILVGGTGLYVRALFEEYADMAPLPDPDLRSRLEAALASGGVDTLFQELERLDPNAAKVVDRYNPVRVRRAIERHYSPNRLEFSLPPFRKFKVSLAPPIDVLHGYIERRLDRMLSKGWDTEVEHLRSAGVTLSAPAMRAIGYATIWRYLDGEIELEEARERILIEMKQYAKRQRTWLRREPSLRQLAHKEPARDLAEDVVAIIEGEP